MPEDVIGSIDGLAGEYVLGTLDAQECASAQQLMSADADFAAKVKVWERRLGELHLMVEPVEPQPQVWARIKARLPAPPPQPQPEPEPQEPVPQAQASPGEPKLPELEFDLDFVPSQRPAGESEPAPATESATGAAVAAEEQAPAGEATHEAPPEVIALPSWGPPSSEPPAEAAPELPVAEPLPEPPASAPAPLPPFVAPKPKPAAAAPDIERKVRSLRRHLAGWRALAAVMALALIALAALIAVWRYAPERLPPELRPVALMRLAGIRVDAGAPLRKPLPPESQFDE